MTFVYPCSKMTEKPNISVYSGLTLICDPGGRLKVSEKVNPYLPFKATILSVIQETSDSGSFTSDLDIKTYRLQFNNNYIMDFLPGQFVELSVPGVGEAPFGFASNPLEKAFIELTIKRTGLLTDAVHALSAGDELWIRGPFGNVFPIEKIRGREILLIAGGLGLAPLRPLISYIFDPGQRDDFGLVNMLIAARSSNDFLYKYDYKEWQRQKNVSLALTIDKAEAGWEGLTGFPHNLVETLDFDKDKTTALLCGPPIMIKAVAQKLLELGLQAEHILTTLEMRMTCGIGKCGKCNIGHQYICVDGPVYSLAQLEKMPNEY